MLENVTRFLFIFWYVDRQFKVLKNFEIWFVELSFSKKKNMRVFVCLELYGVKINLKLIFRLSKTVINHIFNNTRYAELHYYFDIF